MDEAIPWLVLILLIVGTIWMVVGENSRKRRRTAQEYEREVAESKNSLLRAGMLELDKFVGKESEKRAAAAYLKDEELGRTRTGSKGDDADRTAVREEP